MSCDEYLCSYDWTSIHRIGSYATGGLNPAHQLQRLHSVNVEGDMQWNIHWIYFTHILGLWAASELKSQRTAFWSWISPNLRYYTQQFLCSLCFLLSGSLFALSSPVKLCDDSAVVDESDCGLQRNTWMCRTEQQVCVCLHRKGWNDQCCILQI